MSPALSSHWIPVLLKDTQPQATPDLEEEIVYRDYTIVTVSMGIALTGAEVKGVSFVLASSRSIGKEGIRSSEAFPFIKEFKQRQRNGERQRHKSLI